MRFAAEDEVTNGTSFEPSIDTVDAPSEALLHETVRIDSRIVNDGDAAGEITVVIATDGQSHTRESFALDPESNATVETDIEPTSTGERELSIRIDDDETVDRWTGSLAITGQVLALEWAETFIPAERVETSTDTRNLTFACFALAFRTDETTIETYDIGADGIEFVTGAYPEETITDDRLEDFDGAQGRWLGTDDRRTEIVIPDPTLFETADTLELFGYSLLEAETSVTATTNGTTIDTATVPARADGESRIAIDLNELGDADG